MLAQNFKTADDLDITEPQRAALMKVLVLLETGRLVHVTPSPDSGGDYRDDGKFTGHFNMARWRAMDGCGTVCCIAGTAELVGNVTFDPNCGGRLGNLFWVGNCMFGSDISHVTPDQAATALRSYLTTGDARWDLALTTG